MGVYDLNLGSSWAENETELQQKKRLDMAEAALARVLDAHDDTNSTPLGPSDLVLYPSLQVDDDSGRFASRDSWTLGGSDPLRFPEPDPVWVPDVQLAEDSGDGEDFGWSPLGESEPLWLPDLLADSDDEEDYYHLDPISTELDDSDDEEGDGFGVGSTPWGVWDPTISWEDDDFASSHETVDGDAGSTPWGVWDPTISWGDESSCSPPEAVDGVDGEVDDGSSCSWPEKKTSRLSMWTTESSSPPEAVDGVDGGMGDGCSCSWPERKQSRLSMWTTVAAGDGVS